jgi:hypothetical protein
MDYEALRHYLEHLDVNHVALNYRAAPDIVHAEAIETYTPGRRMGLQIADAVASSYFYAVERSSYGMTEESYARLLLRVAYRHQTQLWGYGVKIMPKEAEEERRKGTLFPGLK